MIPVAILAGGRATRLGGGDKALHPFAGATLLDALLARLKSQSPLIGLNANGDPSRFARFGLPVFSDHISGFRGPLAGIHAAMIWARDFPLVATVAIDTPFVPLNLIAALATAAQPQAIVCAESVNRLQPVIALWPTGLSQPLHESLIAQETRRVGLFISRHPVIRVAFGGDGYDPFFNINTPEDLLAAEQLFDHVRALRAEE